MITVVIDPGHGGTRASGSSSAFGARGQRAVVEKSVALALARKLRDRLEPSVRVALTREGDESLAPVDRAALARRLGARVFVSLHANRGEDTWIHTDAGDASRALAREVHRALGREGSPRRRVHGGDLAILDPSLLGDAAACLVDVAHIEGGEEGRLHGRLDSIADALASAIASSARSAPRRGATRWSPVYGGPPFRVALRGDPADPDLAELHRIITGPHATPGTLKDLVVRANFVPSSLTSADVDVVIYFHGYTQVSPSSMDIERDKEPDAGLDFEDPVSGATGRTFPTIALLPRGKFAGSSPILDRDKKPTGRYLHSFTFPSLDNAGVGRLIDFALGHVSRSTSGLALRARRIIFTGSSGGVGAVENAIALPAKGDEHFVDPHEVHLYDGLYSPAPSISAWAQVHMDADAKALRRLGGTPDAAFAASRGALRVFFIRNNGTDIVSGSIHNDLARWLGTRYADVASELCPFYRVESDPRWGPAQHGVMPKMLGWKMLADAGQSIPGAVRPSAISVCAPSPSSGRRTDRDETPPDDQLASNDRYDRSDDATPDEIPAYGRRTAIALADPLDPDERDPQTDPLVAAKGAIPLVQVWAKKAQEALQKLHDQLLDGRADVVRADEVADRHFHFKQIRDDQELLAQINQALVFNRIVNFINIPNVGDIYFALDTRNQCVGGPACAAIGGLGIAGQQIFFRPEYATDFPLRGARAAMLLHECAHFAGSLGNIDHFASEWDTEAGDAGDEAGAKLGVPEVGHTRNYARLLPSEATRNAASLVSYAIEVATGRDRRYGLRDSLLRPTAQGLAYRGRIPVYGGMPSAHGEHERYR